MNRKLACTVMVAAVGISLGTSANAAGPKPFTKTVSYTDATPDPTGNLAATDAQHCEGKLGSDEGIKVKFPAAGTIDVAISGYSGDWALEVRDASGENVAGDDQNPPATESTSVRIKKAQVLQILPCNLAGTPQATVTYTWSPKKK